MINLYHNKNKYNLKTNNFWDKMVKVQWLKIISIHKDRINLEMMETLILKILNINLILIKGFLKQKVKIIINKLILIAKLFKPKRIQN